MKIKRIAAVSMAAVMMLAFSACGEKVELQESTITGEQAQEQFWNLNIESSAGVLDGFRAQSVDEVIGIWRQGKMQGNGALIYAIYSPDLKQLFLQEMIANGSWNMYYNSEPPTEITCSEPEELDGREVIDATLLRADGTVGYIQLIIDVINGGYVVASESIEYADSDLSEDINSTEGTYYE